MAHQSPALGRSCPGHALRLSVDVSDRRDYRRRHAGERAFGMGAGGAALLWERGDLGIRLGLGHCPRRRGRIRHLPMDPAETRGDGSRGGAMGSPRLRHRDSPGGPRRAGSSLPDAGDAIDPPLGGFSSSPFRGQGRVGPRHGSPLPVLSLCFRGDLAPGGEALHRCKREH